MLENIIFLDIILVLRVILIYFCLSYSGLDMVMGLNRWLLNFLMSGPFFDESEKEKADRKKEESNIYNSKRDYVSQVTGFLESGVREMKKDIKKL